MWVVATILDSADLEQWFSTGGSFASQGTFVTI